MTVTINSIDRSDFVLWNTLRVENLLTSQVDTCSFIISNFGDHIFKPTVGKSVVVANGATTIFGGVIVRVTEKSPSYGVIYYEVQCSDYTRVLDQHLVAETYENQTVQAIITDIITNHAPAGFTTTQVSCTVVLKTIQFKYEPVSACLKQLAELVGYDWYVDYAKDIFFKDPAENLASFDVEDDTGTYEKDSLVIRRDNSQTRNSVIVRGGEYLGSTFTASVRADGKQFTFNLPYRYSGFGATLTGNPLTIGVDNIDDPDSYHALYNFQEKVLRFKETDRPNVNATLSFFGAPYLPVIVKYKDQARIDAMFSAEAQGDGKYEYLVVDKSINSKEAARDRARAEISTYGDTLSEGEFVTETAGLLAGQTIRINSASRGINETFVVNRVTTSMKTPNDPIFSISLITTKTMNFISIMKKLLLAENKKIDINENEVLDLVESADEVINIGESVSSSLVHNPQTETVTLAETFTAQSLNYGVQFVLGPQTPSTTKRVFLLDRSLLG